jgi:phospholipid/cholesterol/gamma-HCH transport system substrate-binding protein
MKRDNINYLMVGSFVLAMLLLLFFALMKITGQGGNYDKYYLQLDNITDVTPGTAVTYAGYRVGTLTDIEPIRQNNKTIFQLTLGIKRDWAIPTDSYAQVITPGVLAKKQIDITEGTQTTLLQPGDVIKSRGSTDIMAALTEVGGDLHDLSEQAIKPLLESLNKGLVSKLPAIINDSTRLLKSLNQSAEQLNLVLSPGNQQHISQLLGNANEVTAQLASMSQQVNRSSLELEKLLKESRALISNNSTNINHTVDDLHRATARVSENIESIMHNMDAASRNMNEFTRRLRENPGALLNNNPPKDNVSAH